MIQHLLRGGALLRVGHQHLAHHVLGSLRDLVPGIRSQIVLTLENLVEDGLLGLRPERRHTREEDVQDHPRAPDVRLVAVVALQNLRRDVVGGAHDVVKVLLGLEVGRQAEIDSLDRRVRFRRLQHEVLGLQIAVDDAQVVAVRDGSHHRSEDGRRVLLGVVPPGDDAVEELAALAQLHDDVDVLAALVGVDELDDVRVIAEVVEDADLAAHVLDVLSAHQLSLRDRLARGFALGRLVGDEVGGAELALAELLLGLESRGSFGVRGAGRGRGRLIGAEDFWDAFGSRRGAGGRGGEARTLWKT